MGKEGSSESNTGEGKEQSLQLVGTVFVFECVFFLVMDLFSPERTFGSLKKTFANFSQKKALPKRDQAVGTVI